MEPIFSVHDHVVEPPDLWQARLPKEHRQAGPRVARIDGVDTWIFGEQRTVVNGQVASCGRMVKSLQETTNYDDMRKEFYDPIARLIDMDRDGIAVSMCFPSVTAFSGQRFFPLADKDLALECVKAFNDWMIDDWVGAAPDRFIPIGLLPLWDPVASAREIERFAERGGRAASFIDDPAQFGFPSLHEGTEHWHPLLAAASETGVVLSVHQGPMALSGSLIQQRVSPLAGSWRLWSQMCWVASQWLASVELERYPGLKVHIAESSCGWVPFLLDSLSTKLAKKDGGRTPERAPDMVAVRAKREEWDAILARRFQDHIFLSIMSDRYGCSILNEVTENNVMVGVDYPHDASYWPCSQDEFAYNVASLSEERQAKVLNGNAKRLFRWS